MKKKLIAAVLILVLILGCLAGCGQKEEASPTPSGNEQQNQGGDKTPDQPKGNFKQTTTSKEENALRTFISTEFNTLDFHHYTLSSEYYVITCLYDRFMMQNAAGGYDPWIITSAVPNEDGTVVECEIRDDVFFASGDKMTMEDIVYSLARCENSVFASQLYDNSSMEVVDDTHFRWLFPNEGMNYFALADRANQLFVYNKSFCEAISDDPSTDFLFNVDGSGAYKLETAMTAGGHDVTLVKRDDYWNGKDYAHLDKIIFKYLTGDVEMAFESGDIDYSVYKADTFEQIAKFDNVETAIQYGGSTYYLITNTSEASPFNDIKVREALQYAFDREEVGMVICENSGQVAWTMFTPQCVNWSDCVPHRTLDVAKAQSLMKEAGYSESNPCSIVMFTVSQPSWVATLEILKENLDQCYFSTTIEEGTDYVRYFSSDFDLAVLEIGFLNTFSMYGMMYDINTGLNMALYTGEDADAIAAEVTQAQTPEEAKAAMIHHDAPLCYVPLSYGATLYAFDADLDLGEYANGYSFLKMKWK